MTEYQPLDADLTSLAAASADNSMYYRSGKGAWAPLAIAGGLIFDTGTLSAPGGGATEYGFEALTTAPPNARKIRFNNATAANTTAIYIDSITSGRNDIRLILLDVPAGALLYIQDKNTSTNFIKFLVSAPTIDRGSYIEIPVVAIASTGAIPNDGRALLYISGSGRGVTNGSNAAAGMVGEYLSASNTAGSALTTSVALNVATLALTAGDWDVWGQTVFAEGANTIPTILASGTSPNSAQLPTPAQLAQGLGAMTQVAGTFTKGLNQIMQTGPDRYNLAAPANVYLVSQATFGGGTLSVTGFISARRIR